jgi:hypothetical protein
MEGHGGPAMVVTKYLEALWHRSVPVHTIVSTESFFVGWWASYFYKVAALFYLQNSYFNPLPIFQCNSSVSY